MPASEIVLCGIPFGEENEKEALAYAKACGFTSIQIYTFWREFEPEKRGDFRWDYYDRQVSLIREAGLRYVPFFLMGPKYAAPGWWLADPAHKGLVCLEHGKECPVESNWNPAFREEISRVLAAFADHYRDWDVIESVQPGIGGDYGEAIYPVLGNWPGDYHTHQGFWCGGEDAAADFRSAMRAQYGSVASLNAAWRTSCAGFDSVAPFPRHLRPSRTAWLDMMRWYLGSMTEYAAFWMAECRRLFPSTPVYLCTGGEGQAAIGAHFSDQAKIAARYGGGIRLTNEGNDFARNFQTSVLFHSACAHYGAYLGLEPVGPMLPHGVVNRMYGSAAYGNRQIFHYYHNLVDEAGERNGAGELIRQYAPLIRERQTGCGISLFWPLDETLLEDAPIPKDIRNALVSLRRLYEIDAADEEMILSGALDSRKILIMLDAVSTRAPVLEAIAGWVERGGVLLSNRRTLDTEMRPVAAFDAVFGFTPESEEAWGHTLHRVEDTRWAPRFSTLSMQHVQAGWMGLAGGVRPLLACEDRGEIGFTQVRRCYGAFENPCGKGRAIFYGAALDFDTPADAIFTPSPTFRYLLEDLCRAFGGVEPFELREGDVAHARMEQGLLALREGGIIDRLP